MNKKRFRGLLLGRFLFECVPNRPSEHIVGMNFVMQTK